MNVDFSSLSTGLQIGTVALIVVELVLLLFAVVVNLTTPEHRLTLPHVVWLAISVFIGVVEPLAFLVAGRRKVQSSVTTAGANKATASSVIDELYQ